MSIKSRAHLPIPEKYADLREIFNVLQRDYLSLTEELATLAQATTETAQTTAVIAETTANNALSFASDAETRIDFGFELEP